MTTEITRYNNMCNETKQTLESQIEDLLQIVFVLLTETPGNNLNSTAINLLKYIYETTNVNIDRIVIQIKQKIFIPNKDTLKTIENQKGGQKGFLYYMLRLILILSLLFSLIEAQLTVRSESMEPTVLATQSMRSLIPSFVQSFMNTDGTCVFLVALLASSKYSFANLIEAFQQYHLNEINTGAVTDDDAGVRGSTVTIRDFNRDSLLSNSSLAYGKLTKTVFGDKKIVEHLQFKRPHTEGNNDMILLTEINDAITQRATSALSYVSKNKPGYIKGDVLFLEFGITGHHRETLIVRMGEDGITRWGIWETNTIDNIATYNAKTKPYIVPPNFWDNEHDEQKKISIITDSPLKGILFDWLKILGPESTQIPSTLRFNIEMVRNDKTPVEESLPLTNYMTSYHVGRVQEVIQLIVKLKKDFLRRGLIGFTMDPVKFVNPIGTAIKMDNINTEVVTESELQSLSERFQNFVIKGNDGFDRDELESFNSEIAELFVRGFEPGKGLKIEADNLQSRIQSIYTELYKIGKLKPKNPVTHKNSINYYEVTNNIDNQYKDLVKKIGQQDLSGLLNTLSSLEKLSSKMDEVLKYRVDGYYTDVMRDIQEGILTIIKQIIPLKHDAGFLDELSDKINRITITTESIKENAKDCLEQIRILKNPSGGKVVITQNTIKNQKKRKYTKKRHCKISKKKYKRNHYGATKLTNKKLRNKTRHQKLV